MRRPALAAACLAAAVLLTNSCGDDGPTATRTPIDPRPLDENFYLIAMVEVVPPIPNETFLPRTCDGDIIPVGTVFLVDPLQAGGGLGFGASRPQDGALGNPTLVTPLTGGTDRVDNLSVLLEMPPISPVDALAVDPAGGDFTANPPYDPPESTATRTEGTPIWSGEVSLDPFCPEQDRVTYYTEPRNNCQCVDPAGTDPDYCEYGCNDQLLFTEYTTEQYVTDAGPQGETVFSPGTGIKGCAQFTGQAEFFQGGTVKPTRVLVTACFRFPAVSPVATFNIGTPDPCSTCP